MSLPSGLQYDLRALSAEARKKFPAIKDVCIYTNTTLGEVAITH